MNSDLYSFLLFILYRMKDDEHYSTLSKLIYMLPEDKFLMLCKYFGGQTITIPTLYEMKTLIYALQKYCDIDINGKDYKKEFDNLRPTVHKKDIKQAYEVIKKYAEGFEPQSSDLFTK